LKTMSEWDYSVFNEKLGKKTQYGIVCGRPNSGKTELTNVMVKDGGYIVLDMGVIGEKVKARLGTEEEPFEGEVPIAEIEKDVVACINGNPNGKFLFDGFKHGAEAFVTFLEQFGTPKFLLCLTADDKTVG